MKNLNENIECNNKENEFRYGKFSENRSLQEAIEIYNQRIEDAIMIYNKFESKFIIRTCPFCEAEEYEELEPFHDKYGIVKCKRCNSIYVNPCPTQEALNYYYENCKCNELLERIYTRRAKKTKKTALDSRVESITRYILENEKDEINILELGCSSGGFLKKLKEYLELIGCKKKVLFFGVDTNKSAIESNEDSELNLYFETAESFLAKTNLKFDIVWHAELIEHIIDPISLCKTINTVMYNKGYMIFTTPNQNSLEMKNISYNATRILACSVFPPMHLNAFSTLNITHFAIVCGFSIVKIETPGIFDVDMISLQSVDDKNKLINKLVNLNDDMKGFVQYLLKEVDSSSHMQCVFRKLLI